MTTRSERIAVYPGSFDPITFAHVDIIRAASKIFDRVYVAVAKNTGKEPLFPIEERLDFIRQAVKDLSNVTAESFEGLAVNYARQKRAIAAIRGIRAVSDFDYEFQMALANRKLEPAIPTVFLMPGEDHFYISSKLIKEITFFGGDVSRFIPQFIVSPLRKRLKHG